ncbi:MAG: DUF58 domain-containing protein [Candidatus Latescibacterota bacterium]|nr:MAG: DUF58 domain-containing protein [Candidatus Latescibacterota bacterium]
MSALEEGRRFLDPEVVARLARMDIKARLVVEGFIAGLHKSPYRGFSVEFAEHRQYMPGDPLRHVDWKVYAKSDKFYVKEYEEETNLRAYLLLDASGSMGYGSGSVTKFTYAAQLAAALAYLMLRQRDSVGLVLFDDQLRRFLAPRAAATHLHAILRELEGARTSSRTDVGGALHALTERIRRRGLVLLLSDLMDDPEKILTSLRYFRHKKHEVVVFHILDPKEVRFDFDRESRFEDMEKDDHITAQPWRIRAEYAREVERWRDRYRSVCREHRIDYNFIDTSTPYDVALFAYLAKRARLG